MTASKVYFTSMKARNGDNLQNKLKRLIKRAGIESIDFDGKYTAIKMHFGERGNLAYLRPNYARTVVEEVKELGGRPFLTDCNTLYIGGRKNALDHIETAYINGFTPYTTGCHIIIADGIKGTDEVLVPIDGELCKEAKIGRALMDADIVISLTHFKGHEMTGFGGALKNLGMGGGSRAGKMDMHSTGKPFVKKDLCIGCHACERICAHDGPQFDENNRASIDHDKCVGCGRCLGVCPKDAVCSPQDGTSVTVNKKIAEYTMAVIKDRPNFHISIVADVSPYCDCHGENDRPIVPNVGMFASFDPVALDVACADAVNAQPIIEDSLLGESKVSFERDYFGRVSPNTDWTSCIKHAEALGIGSSEYELIEVR